MQHVLRTLKNPNHNYKKEEEGAVGRASDYFLNYLNWGLDLLFDGTEHALKKIIVHNNLPVHPHFGFYDRCNFVLHF